MTAGLLDQHVEEGPCRHDCGPILASHGEQVVLVTGDEIISLASFAHCQQKIIRGIFGAAGLPAER